MLEMLKYLGVKMILACAMTKGEFETSRHIINGCEHPQDAEGYLVQYDTGYESWSPKEPFEKAYRRTEGLTFGLAIEALKSGKRVAREGWNGKGMWLDILHTALVPGQLPVCPSIRMKTAQDAFVVGWLASQTDMLAEDWRIID